MKAITYSNYGGPEVLQLHNLQKPITKENEVLIKIYATSVTAGDSRMRSFTVPTSQWIFARLYLGLFSPRMPILGMELAGIVEAIGEKVTKFKLGDEVFASTLHANFGAYAEYKCFPENGAISLKPTNLNYLESATLPIGAGTALRFLRKAKIQNNKNILVYGAAGSVGTYAVQIAKYYGAQVTALCSTSGIGVIQSLGSDRIIDYTKEDISTWGSYDLVFDAVGKIKASQLKSILKKNGKMVSVKSNPGNINSDDLITIKKLVESTAIKPVITSIYKLEDVAKAHVLVDSGHKKGNVSIEVAH